MEVKYDALIAWEPFVKIGEPRCVGALAGEIATILLHHLGAFSELVYALLNFITFLVLLSSLLRRQENRYA